MNLARSMRGFLLVLAASLAFAPAALAITDEEIFRQMRFNFINPGARALGLGGSFIAIADDATAAQANPAGLMQLAAPEFFVEERFIGGDKTSGEESQFFIFSSSNERRAVTTPTFFSFVKPWKTFALGFSRQELINSRVKTESAFLFDPIVFGLPPGDNIGWTGEGDAAVNVTNWNVSAAWQPIEWLAIGGTASFGQFHIDSKVSNLIEDPAGAFLCGIFDCSIFPPPALQHPQNWYQTAIDDDDNDVTFSFGILILPMEQFSVGLVFRQGADYEFEQEVTDGLSSTAGFSTPAETLTHSFNLPDSFGLGLKWRPGENWTVAADVVRVTYSDLLEGLVTEVNILTNIGTVAGFPPDFTVDDVTEIHAGVEYLFSEAKWPLSVRGGVFYDPDNVLRDTTGNYGDALAGRDDELHYNVGAGIVIQQKFQADVAISISEIGNEGLASFIFRF